MGEAEVTAGHGAGDTGPVESADVPRAGRCRAAGAASVSLVGVGVANAIGPPDLLRLPVRLRRLDPAFNGFRIAVVSDIHLGPLAGARTPSGSSG